MPCSEKGNPSKAGEGGGNTTHSGESKEKFIGRGEKVSCSRQKAKMQEDSKKFEAAKGKTHHMRKGMSHPGERRMGETLPPENMPLVQMKNKRGRHGDTRRKKSLSLNGKEGH